MNTFRFAAEIVGWLAVAYGAWWMLVLLIDFAFIVLAARWRRFVKIGRLAIYFASAGEIGTVTSFSTANGNRYDQLFWYVFWRK